VRGGIPGTSSADGPPAQPGKVSAFLSQDHSGGLGLPSDLPAAKNELTLEGVTPVGNAKANLYVDGFSANKEATEMSGRVFWPGFLAGLSPGFWPVSVRSLARS